MRRSPTVCARYRCDNALDLTLDIGCAMGAWFGVFIVETHRP
jgi:hypothetical protein